MKNAIPARSRLVRYAPLIVFVFAFLLYSNTLNHEFVLDDRLEVIDNAAVQRGIAGIPQLFSAPSAQTSMGDRFDFYRPATLSLFAVETEFFGNDPAAFHVVHVTLYAFLCVVLYLLLCRLFRDAHDCLPAIAALLFAAHPIHTEVGANIKSADELLSLLFAALALLSAIRFAAGGRRRYLFLCGACFLVALFSKENAVTFLVVVPLALFVLVRVKDRPVGVNRLFSIGAVQVTAALIYFAARHAAVGPGPDTIDVINNTLAGASFGQRYATIAYVLLYDLRLLVFPHPLTWDYGYNQVPLKTWTDGLVVTSVLLYASGCLLAFGTLKRRNVFAFCVAWFIVTLSPTANIVMLIVATMAERFLFTPSLALCIAVAALMIAVSRRAAAAWQTPILVGLLALLLVPYSLKTYARNEDWKSNFTLFKAGVEASPNSYRANMSFGWENLRAGEMALSTGEKDLFFAEAAARYAKAVAIYDKVALDWYHLGVSDSYLGRTDDAVRAYTRVLALTPGDRDTCYNLAAIDSNRKDYRSAVTHYLCVYAADPSFMDVALKIGLAYHQLNDLRQAIFYYEKYLGQNPGSTAAITDLSIAYRTLGDRQKADYYTALLAHVR